jgi:FkbM family methyltransferase
VGANVGRYTRFFAKHCADNATVYSFEPNPSAYRLLRANTSKLPNVSSFSVALGESREIRGLQTPTDKFGNPISALSSVDQSANFANATSEAIEIQSLDAMIQDEAIEVRAPILMKIDVEGYELQVLKGALEMISKQHPMIYFECQEYHLARTKIEPEKIWNLFKTQDYMILSEKNGSLFEKHNIDTDTENYFAFHKSHIENWKDIINYPYFHINY